MSSEIPQIDISNYLSDPEQYGPLIAQQIADACTQIGFFTITGHGISEEYLQETAAIARGFFDQETAAKRPYEAGTGMGYIRVEGEQLAASLDDSAEIDYKESLNLMLPVSDAAWPHQPPELRERCQDYLNKMTALAAKLMQLFAVGLEMPHDFFADKIDDPRCIMRLLNYPPVKNSNSATTRAGAHTDYGTLTILWSPNSRGLQARNRQGEWVNVLAPASSFIINIGDLMMNWTNDKWISTLHRVVPQPENANKRRQSIAFFHNPNPDALIECISSCTDADNPPKYAPIPAKDHLEMKIAKALGEDDVKL